MTFLRYKKKARTHSGRKDHTRQREQRVGKTLVAMVNISHTEVYDLGTHYATVETMDALTATVDDVGGQLDVAWLVICGMLCPIEPYSGSFQTWRLCLQAPLLEM